jgi:hypothetical protein
MTACSRAAAVQRWLPPPGPLAGPPPAGAPTSPCSHQPRARQPRPPNSPAAAAAPLSCPCMPVRTGPLLAIRAPKGSDPIRAATALTQGAGEGDRVPVNISLLPLPPRSPELDPPENVWQSHPSKLAVQPSVPGLRRHCRALLRCLDTLLEQPWKIMSRTGTGIGRSVINLKVWY